MKLTRREQFVEDFKAIWWNDWDMRVGFFILCAAGVLLIGMAILMLTKGLA